MSYFRTALTTTVSGLSQQAQQLILDSRWSSTKKQYTVFLHKWNSYCADKNISPYLSSTVDGINFLAELFSEGYGYSSLNTARSALASVLSAPSTVTFGSHPLVSRFMKGVFNNKPSLPRYSTTWDVNVVLEHLQTISFENISLKLLTMKCVMLLALLTGQRIQTLQCILTHNVKFTCEGCEIVVDSLLKTSRPGHHLKPMKFQPYHIPELCVVDHLKAYLQKTASLRNECTRLLISHQKPFKAVSKDTISLLTYLVHTAHGLLPHQKHIAARLYQ